MDSSTQTPNQIPEISNNTGPKIATAIIALVLVVGGIIWYQWAQNKATEEKIQQMIREVAEAAAQVNLTEAERAKMVKDAQNQPSFTLPPDEAKAREAEILSQSAQ